MIIVNSVPSVSITKSTNLETERYNLKAMENILDMFRQLSVIHTVLLLVLYYYNTNSILISDRTYREFVMEKRRFLTPTKARVSPCPLNF